MPEQLFLVIGEVFVDTHLDIIRYNDPIVRLGGIFHMARAFSALNVEYALAYYAPSYLDKDIDYFACVLNTRKCYKLGNVDSSPNIMLVRESKESGNQGYYNILRKKATYNEIGDFKELIATLRPTDILILPGRYNTRRIIEELETYNGKIHIDFHYDSEGILDNLNTTIDTMILSTSSVLFKEQCKGSLTGVLEYFHGNNINKFLIKENRGGSYCYNVNTQNKVEAPAYYVPTLHSVGVGDVYNAVFIYSSKTTETANAMRFASLCAAKYAETMDFNFYHENIQILLNKLEEFIQLEGTRLSWDERSHKDIYIAAPDFPDVNTKPLYDLVNCLMYHNFKLHLPIQENGLVEKEMDNSDELSIYNSDVVLLSNCDLLIAVLLFNDPGTLVELGMFKQSGKPTIIYDPYHICTNMFVRCTPDYLCDTLEDVINATYSCLGRKL